MSILITFIITTLYINAVTDAYCVNFGWLGCIDVNNTCLKEGRVGCKNFGHIPHNVCACVIEI
jgi:hypothetical protein